MKPKEKAAELISQFEVAIKHGEKFGWNNEAHRSIMKAAKASASIAVEEIIKEYQDLYPTVNSEFVEMCKLKLDHWQQVQQELINL